jgi:hypothetical protein
MGKIKRVVIKRFRQYLNEKFKDMKYKNHRWHQETRAYGDYLYFQDRGMFNSCLNEALDSKNSENRFADFKNFRVTK